MSNTEPKRPFNPFPFESAIEPKRDAERHLRGFESINIVRRLNFKTATAIEAAEESHAVARQLRACADGDTCPCLLLVCLVCMRAYRRWFTDQAIRLARELKDRTGSRGTGVTVIPAGFNVPTGRLHEISIPAFRLKIWKWIVALKLDLPVIAGIDVSFNFVKDSDEPGHWQIHFAFVILGHGNDKESHDRLKKRIKAVIPLEPTDRALRIVPLRNPMRQLSYLQKSQFYYRISVIDKHTGNKNTVKHPPPLAGAHLAEATLWQQGLPMTGRLILHGLERRGGQIVESSFSTQESDEPAE